MQQERSVAPLLVQVAEGAFDRRLRVLAPDFVHLLPAAQQASTVDGELGRWVQQAKAGLAPAADPPRRQRTS